MRAEHAEVAAEILELSLHATKARTIKAIYERIKPGPDGRIRTVLSPVGTETGRLASSDTFLEASTNLQNIPKKTAMLDPLYDVRRCMVPRQGYVFVEADLSLAEARATSAYARDRDTLAVFAEGVDIHKWTAAKIFGVGITEVTKGQRHLGKMARHALNYGMGWELFVERINKDADLTGIAISAAQGKKIVTSYHEANPALLCWWDEVWAEAQAQGYLVNAFGRRRDFLSPYVRKNDCIAYLPQSTIADLLNVRLCEAYERCPLLRDTMLLQIHDAILCEVKESVWEDAAWQLREIIQVPLKIGDITITVPADVSYSRVSWGELETWHG